MKVVIYARHMRAEVGVSRHMLAVCEGFQKHGIEPVVTEPGRPVPCDLAVTWGVKKKLESLSGRRNLVVERGYIGDRYEKWTSMGFDGLNGYADFCNSRPDPARWAEHYEGVLKPWRTRAPGSQVVIMGQVQGDASLRGLNINLWYREVAERLLRAGHRVGFRPHPLFKAALPMAGVNALTGSLDDALARAKWVVTFNSNSAVDAVVAGIPAVTCDPGSMAWEVTGHNPIIQPPKPDRAAWAQRMAWTQWTLEEIAAGHAWDHLKVGME